MYDADPNGKHAVQGLTMIDTPSVRSRFRVDGMDCPSCASKITNAVRRVSGVEDVSVSVSAGTMTVLHRDVAHLGAAILRQVHALGGYRAAALPSEDGPAGQRRVHGHGDHAGHGHEPGGSHAHPHVHDHEVEGGPWWRSGRNRLTIVCGLSLVMAY